MWKGRNYSVFNFYQSHDFQNPKYNNSSSKGNYSERYGHDRMRNSPNGNSFRSDSPDSQSPRDRPYPKHNNSYVHKDRENNRLRDKYSADCVNRSPKDQRRRETDHRTNHEREGPEVRWTLFQPFLVYCTLQRYSIKLIWKNK